MSRDRKRLPTALLAVFAYLGAFGMMPAAQAGMIGTETALQSEDRAERVAKVRDMLDQDRVAEQMVALGVNPADAKARVASLTDAELARLEGKLEELPAGGILGVIGVVFVVLLILELVGVTNIFTRI